MRPHKWKVNCLGTGTGKEAMKEPEFTMVGARNYAILGLREARGY